MKKYTKRLLLSAAITVAAMASSTAPANNAPLLTLTVITPHTYGNRYDEIKTLVGKKTASGSCTANQAYPGDLRFMAEDSSIWPTTAYLYPGLFQDEIVGPAKDCFKIEVISNGNIYSTGNIDLTWNPRTNEYVAANPSAVTLNIKEYNTQY